MILNLNQIFLRSFLSSFVWNPYWAAVFVWIQSEDVGTTIQNTIEEGMKVFFFLTFYQIVYVSLTLKARKFSFSLVSSFLSHKFHQFFISKSSYYYGNLFVMKANYGSYCCIPATTPPHPLMLKESQRWAADSRVLWEAGMERNAMMRWLTT